MKDITKAPSDARNILCHRGIATICAYYSSINEQATLDRWHEYLLFERSPLAEARSLRRASL